MAHPSFTSKHLRRMRRDWDRRGKANARHYVLTGKVNWSDEEFFKMGELLMQEQILNDLTNICQGSDPKQMRVLEIGCGAGRMTKAFANFFGEVYAVDISREMVREARRGLSGFSNAHVFRNNGSDLKVLDGGWRQWFRSKPVLQFDFAFSVLVFQHISNYGIIESYVREVHRRLRPGGLFKFQVQGSQDVKLDPKSTWYGAPLSPQTAEEMAERCGFELRYQTGAGTDDYWLWFFKKENTQ